MSGSTQSNPPPSPSAAAAQGADPSMEDILASIRRILSEDEPAAPDPNASEPHTPDPHAPNPPAGPPAATHAMPIAAPPHDDIVALDNSMLVADTRHTPSRATLIAPETAAAVASTMGGLLRSLGEHTQTHRGGPTIEDIVREEIRPLLKHWLDTHLQPLVERQVRVELERITGRAVS